jgi:hypothetical protein
VQAASKTASTNIIRFIMEMFSEEGSSECSKPSHS